MNMSLAVEFRRTHTEDSRVGLSVCMPRRVLALTSEGEADLHTNCPGNARSTVLLEASPSIPPTPAGTRGSSCFLDWPSLSTHLIGLAPADPLPGTLSPSDCNSHFKNELKQFFLEKPPHKSRCPTIEPIGAVSSACPVPNNRNMGLMVAAGLWALPEQSLAWLAHSSGQHRCAC